jgi:DNA-binding CsgD family transcriptional regulator
MAGPASRAPIPVAQTLLERERELAHLDASIECGVAGEAVVVLVEGPAGIGKSRLLAEARRRAAERGLRVLGARGGELEREFPFGVVRQLFEPLLTDGVLAERALAGSASSAVPVFDSVSVPTADAQGDTSFAALHGLYWLTVNLAGDGPLALVVDDLHWCDRPSLRFLAYLVRRLEGLPVLVVGSLRPSEPGADAALLAELAGDPLSGSLHPGPLTRDAVAELVRRRLGVAVEAPFVAACHTSTGGNPLLLNELLKALDGERVRPVAANVAVVNELGPRAASRAVLLRLARLPEPAVAVARALAVLGEGAEMATIARLAGLDELAAAEATALLIRAEMLRPETPVGFVHPLVQAAVYRDLTPAERELRHEAAASLLHEQGAPAENVAAHLLVTPARGEPAVTETLRTAARAALAKGAPESAVSALTRALEEPPPPALRSHVLLELGRASALVHAPAATGHLRAAYESLTDPLERGLAADGLVRALLFTNAPQDAAVLARQAREELPAAELDLRRRLEAVELIALFFGVPDEHGMLERLRRYRTERLGETVGDRMLAAAAGWAWTLDGGSADQVSQLALWALERDELLAVDSGLMSIVATIPLALADRPEALTAVAKVSADARTKGSIFATTGAQLWGGYTAFLRGELTEAEREYRDSLEMLGMWGVPASAYSCALLAESLLEQGAKQEAWSVLGQSEVVPALSDRMMLLDRSTTSLLLADGRVEEALERTDAARTHAGWKRHPIYTPWRSLRALALDRLGRADEAIASAADELAIARAWGAPGGLGRALRILGTLEREQGLGHLEEAVEVLHGSSARLERAKALAALGGRLRRDRRPAEAREPLRHALELAETCGASPLVDEIRSEIYATGARPRTTALHGAGSLTASERRVAALAAEGQSNRDIAQSLYVTPKTVEVHLSSTYRKLGIASRHDLAAALAPTA